MGYLAQKKKLAREDRFLYASAVVFCLLTIFLFFPQNFLGLKTWLFQIYLVNLLVFLYSLAVRRFSYVAVFAVFLVVNYFQIASSAHVFFNADVNADHVMSIEYAPDKNLTVRGKNISVARQGHLVLGNKTAAPFAELEKDSHKFTLVRVYLRGLSDKRRKVALQQLRNFISEQDDPVIVYGDFGVPAWSHDMDKFMEDTRLEVKNRLLFTDKGKRYNFLRAPGFYLLSFQNLGIEDLSVAYPRNPEAYPLIKMVLGFY